MDFKLLFGGRGVRLMVQWNAYGGGKMFREHIIRGAKSPFLLHPKWKFVRFLIIYFFEDAPIFQWASTSLPRWTDERFPNLGSFS